MHDAHRTTSTATAPLPARHPAALRPRSWFHTISLGILFMLLAIVADSIGATGQDADGNTARTASTAR